MTLTPKVAQRRGYSELGAGSIRAALIIHLINGTYELFRHFYGLRRFNKGVERPYGAVIGVLQTVLQMMTPHSPMLISGAWFEFEIRKIGS